MNIIESINNINESIQEADMAVLESMMHIIDKREMFVECNNDTLDEMFMESMEWFLESKNRERDRTPRNDIAKWMDENGYWYDGDNPKKKKECNRMYHFLQQWKFDPKTETIETDIKLSNGSNKRIKFNIDKAEHKWDQNDLDRGNAWYNSENDDISIGSKTLKGQQIGSQIIGKHEEGHADDIGVKRGTKGHRNDVNKVKGQHSKFISNKPYMNNGHDERSEEGYADAYAVMHAKKRTKNWGKNKETRPFKRSEVEEHFKRMADRLGDVENTVAKAIKETDKSILLLKESLFYGWDDKNIDVRDIGNIIKLQKEYNKQMDGFEKAIENIGDKLKDPDYFDRSFTAKYNKMQELKNKIRSTDGEIKDIENIEKEYYELKATVKLLSNSRLYDMDAEDSKNQFKKTIDNHIKLYSRKDKGYINYKGKNDYIIDRKLAEKIFNTKDITEEKALIMAKEYYEPSIRRWISKLEDTLKELEEYKRTGKHMKDLASQMRYEFAKQFVKEYFAELFDDMCIAE